MDKEQKQYKALIRADLKIVSTYANSDDKALRLQAAYHMQQAIEKTIKLKAEIEGLSLWGAWYRCFATKMWWSSNWYRSA